MRRVLLGIALISGLWVAMLAAPSHAVEAPRWEDKTCDVRGYDYATDEFFARSCRRVGVNWAAAERNRDGLFIRVKLQEFFEAYSNERQAVWLNTDNDPRPEFLAFIQWYNGGKLYRVRDWRSQKRLVPCDDDRYFIGPFNELLRARIPRSCLNHSGEVRMCFRSLDRYDRERSFRQDYFPARRTWSQRF